MAHWTKFIKSLKLERILVCLFYKAEKGWTCRSNWPPEAHEKFIARLCRNFIHYSLTNHFAVSDYSQCFLKLKDIKTCSNKHTCWEANRTGAVARPSFRSAAVGFPSCKSLEIKSNKSSISCKSKTNKPEYNISGIMYVQLENIQGLIIWAPLKGHTRH